ncbi:hypothetical protein PR202_gb17520 [Eleusine coracana subsp. coracana]|uniref:Alpha/beta hydrolase fold-3 domain-containing protein n=1 Tax=Eleusine coracana subsp. coracana TaxID=191504 RepID=A0AAV5F3P9_ELECO|nr:hypothetical protein PR202_gb17520 [Eleusine coracana subsp. coracana]
MASKWRSCVRGLVSLTLPVLFLSSFLYLSTRQPSLDIAVREEAAASTLQVVVDRAAASTSANATVTTRDKVRSSDTAAVANEGGVARVDVADESSAATDAAATEEASDAKSRLAKPRDRSDGTALATAENSTSSDAADPVVFDFRPYVFVHKSGRVHRFHGTVTVPPGVDAATGVASTDATISTDVSARLYLPPLKRNGKQKKNKLPVLLYFHGGAFVIESPFSPLYHAFLNGLVAKVRAVVAVSVHYRLAPEHPLPAAYDDAWAALQWTASNCRSSSGPASLLADHGDPARIFLAGDSSGGNIAHNLAPVGSEPGERWAREGLEQTWKLVCGGRYGIDDPHVNPLAAPETWRGMAGERVLVTVAGRDNFRDRGVAYAEGTWRCT